MPLTFGTLNLNERIYKRMMQRILWEYLRHGKQVKDFLDRWDIEILDKKESKTKFFDHVVTTSGQTINPNIPSGVTGKFHIYFFLHDSDNLFMMRENSDRIQHELCHALLYDKLGSRDNIFVKDVHKAEEINDKFLITFWFYNPLVYWKKMPISIANIRRWFIDV